MLSYLFNRTYDCSGVRQDCNEESITIILPGISSSQIRDFPFFLLNNVMPGAVLRIRWIRNILVSWSEPAKSVGMKNSNKKIWKFYHSFKNNKSWKKSWPSFRSGSIFFERIQNCFFFYQFSSFKRNLSAWNFIKCYFFVEHF